ncbi:MAG: hypothetical protein K6G91_09250 [Kiritimatiellae bacterium]|nr:hypothetical protein [Kiritimatiellia bacterium]
MKKLYLVVLSAAISRDEVIRSLEGDDVFGVWFYSMANSLFIYSSLTADLVYEAIKKVVPNDERFFVTEVNLGNCQGWMPKKHWDMINWNGADKKYTLDFQGYYRRPEYLLPVAGVYCVYRGIYIEHNNTVSLKQLLYIGQSKNVKEMNSIHENLDEWKAKLGVGEELQYSMATLPEQDLERCGAALIYKNKPSCNQSGVDTFSYRPTLLDIKGCAALLQGGLVE